MSILDTIKEFFDGIFGDTAQKAQDVTSGAAQGMQDMVQDFNVADLNVDGLFSSINFDQLPTIEDGLGAVAQNLTEGNFIPQDQIQGFTDSVGAYINNPGLDFAGIQEIVPNATEGFAQKVQEVGGGLLNVYGK